MDLFYRRMFSFILGKYLEVGFLGRMAGVCLSFEDTAKLFHSSCTGLYPHLQHIVSVAPRFHHHKVLSALFLIGILVGVQWYLIVILVCISLMTDEVEHLFFPVLICHSYILFIEASI